MAGEKIGKAYEAILNNVLESLRTKGVFSGNIFWNKTPEGLYVEPDFIIGTDINSPEYLLLSTHIGSAKDSEKKCWRNIGELCEAKSTFTRLIVINIIFDSVMKADLKQIQAEAFDSQLIVGDMSYGSELQHWVDSNADIIPSEQEEKAAAIKELIKTDKALNGLFVQLENDVKKCFIQASQSRDLLGLWQYEQARVKHPSPNAKNTYLRRGFAKRILLGAAFDGERINKSDGPWLQKLGLVKPTIAGYTICDDELRWFIETKWAKKYNEISAPCSSEKFISHVEKVRSFPVLDAYAEYVIDNYDTLCTSEGMYQCLIKQHEDPAAEIEIPEDITKPSNVWIYDYIAALTKAVDGRSQAFGYASFASHRDAKASKIGNMYIGEWCNCFINQYFARSDSFFPDEKVIKYVAMVLADQLSKIKKEACISKRAEILEQYISKEYEVTLLSHAGFEPLVALLIEEGVIEKNQAKESIRTCFAEKAGVGGRSGKVSVFHIKNTLIAWKSAYAGHPADKKKELSGRAVGLRYTWNADEGMFVTRPGVKKLILLLDGTWQQQHLDAMIKAGWDEIYYPEEIDKLKAAII